MTDIEYLEKYVSKKKLKNALERLENGEPVQYIVGNTNFYGYIIEVNKNVLIPRFETEELVEKTLKIIDEYFNSNISILDIGTGSGCISIALKKKLESSNIDAVDVSAKALKVACKNALNNNVDINFIKSNLFSKIEKEYDVIISNPPYVSREEKIMDVVKNNEPHKALYADNEGLEFYQKILKNASKFLNKKSLIAFEIGWWQGDSIMKIAEKYFPNATISLEKDYSGKDRFIFVKNI